MRVLRNIFSQLHEYVLWLLLSTVLWGWIFASFVTDTKAEKKEEHKAGNDCEAWVVEERIPIQAERQTIARASRFGAQEIQNLRLHKRLLLARTRRLQVLHNPKVEQGLLG